MQRKICLKPKSLFFSSTHYNDFKDIICINSPVISSTWHNVHNEAASFVPLLFTNWILTKQRRCSLRFALSAKNPGRMVMTYCEQLALIDIEMRLAGGAQKAVAELHCSDQWEVLWHHVIQCFSPPIQISKDWLSCIQFALITLGQPSVPVLRQDEEMCPRFVLNLSVL